MIFKREFSKNLKSLLIWSAVLACLILITMSVYPQFAKNQQTMNEFLKAYPESMKKAFGLDKLAYGTVLGFYGVEIYLMTTLLGSIYAALLGSNIIAKESNDKTIEFLLAKPVLRNEIVAQKLLAVFVNIVLLNVAIVLSSLAGFQFAKNADFSLKTFAILSLAVMLLHLTFGAISFLLSSIMKKTRNIISISLGLVFVEYFLHVMSGISDKLSNFKYISFFSYIDAGNIVSKGALDMAYIIIMTAIILISIIASFIIYHRKDITA